jgi:PIN domain nuclease of toxin-antitoxin system
MLLHRAILADQPICLDSAVIIAVIAAKRPVTDVLRPLLRHPDLSVVISTISLAEAVVRPARDGDANRVTAIHRGLLTLPRMQIIDLDQRHAIEAAYVRAQTGLKLPDASVVATARLANAFAILGNDRQWRNKPLGVPYHHMDDILALA